MPSSCTACPRIADWKSPTGVIDSPRSIIYDQAENRLHVQKAILHTLLLKLRRIALPKKVVLAYSGGLDTSIIIPWLKETLRRLRSDRHDRRPRPAGRSCRPRTRKRSPRAPAQPTSKICAKNSSPATSGRRCAPAPSTNTNIFSARRSRARLLAKRQVELAQESRRAMRWPTAARAKATIRFASSWPPKRSRRNLRSSRRGANGTSLPRRSHRVRAIAQHSGRSDQEEYLQPRPQHLAPEPRRRRSRRSRKRARRIHVAMDRLARESARSAHDRRNRL